MTIIKTKIFLCTTAIHTGQERDHDVGLKMDTESVSDLPIKIKWIIVSEINTEFWKINILPHTLILVS